MARHTLKDNKLFKNRYLLKIISVFVLVIMVCMLTGFGNKGKNSNSLPDSFVYVTDVIDDVVLDIRYYGTYNFTGTRIDGYQAPVAILTKEAAKALKQAADSFKEQGYILKVFDAYRPQTAVNYFAKWAKTPSDNRTKVAFYPNVDKSKLFEQGYLSRQSAHTRGSAVDLTLIDFKTGRELDMGTGFDFLDPFSAHYSTQVTPEQKNNREILRKTMVASGFTSYTKEWWHYTLKNEPYPHIYFDFPVR